jgi:hypothetical protein
MSFEGDWAKVASEFRNDGMYRYLEVEGVTAGDWQRVLDVMRQSAEAFVLIIDGVDTELPSRADELLSHLRQADVQARLRIYGVDYTWCIWVPESLSFSLCQTIRDPAQFDGLCRFATLLGSITGKPVMVTYEGCSVIGQHLPSTGAFRWFKGSGQTELF